MDPTPLYSRVRRRILPRSGGAGRAERCRARFTMCDARCTMSGVFGCVGQGGLSTTLGRVSSWAESWRHTVDTAALTPSVVALNRRRRRLRPRHRGPDSASGGLDLPTPKEGKLQLQRKSPSIGCGSAETPSRVEARGCARRADAEGDSGTPTPTPTPTPTTTT